MNHEIVKSCETRVAVFMLRKDGIVVQKIKEEVEITKEDAMELIEAHKKLTPGRSPMLILHTPNYSLNYDAQMVLAHDNFPVAIAIITKTAATKATLNILFRLFDIIKKKHIPKRLFLNEDEAIGWLKKINVFKGVM